MRLFRRLHEQASVHISQESWFGFFNCTIQRINSGHFLWPYKRDLSRTKRYKKAIYFWFGIWYNTTFGYLAFCIITLWTILSNFLEFSSVTTKCLSPLARGVPLPLPPLFSILIFMVRLTLFTVMFLVLSASSDSSSLSWQPAALYNMSPDPSRPLFLVLWEFLEEKIVSWSISD